MNHGKAENGALKRDDFLMLAGTKLHSRPSILPLFHITVTNVDRFVGSVMNIPQLILRYRLRKFLS
jgi:hypothetical protein